MHAGTRAGQGPQALVVGVGRFGSRALGHLCAAHPRWALAALDRDGSTLEPWRARGVEAHVGDAAATLDALLRRGGLRWVVPAVPFHLAHAWVLHRLSGARGARRVSLPRDLPVPHPLPGAGGDVYSSHATFRCPEDCMEPAGRCTVTGQARPFPLFRLLGRLTVPGFRVMGVRSRQMGPGVGGLRASDLRALLAKLEGASGQVLLFTACRCHGVLSGLEL